jgi:hypothetical protein
MEMFFITEFEAVFIFTREQKKPTEAINPPIIIVPKYIIGIIAIIAISSPRFSNAFNDAWLPTTSPTSQTNEMHIIHKSMIDHTFLSIKTPPLHQDLWIRFSTAFIISQSKTNVNSTPKKQKSPAKAELFVYKIKLISWRTGLRDEQL